MEFYQKYDSEEENFYNFLQAKITEADGILMLAYDAVLKIENEKIIYEDKEKNQAIFVEDGNGGVELWDINLNDGVDEQVPVITEVRTTNDSITFKATDSMGIVAYAITQSEEKPKEWKDVELTTILEKTETGLEKGKTYYIWVKDEEGNISEYRTAITVTMEGLTSANTTFTYEPSGWTNGEVKVTVSSTQAIGEYTIQTSRDAEKWEDTPSQTFTENDSVMYARLVDGSKQPLNGWVTANVDKIDKINPEVTGSIATTNKIVITATDEASGIVGYAITESTTKPAESKFVKCANTKLLSATITGKTQGHT